MAETQQNTIADLVSQARERLRQELGAQAEQLQKLEQTLGELRARHGQLEAAVGEQLDALSRVELPAAAPVAAVDNWLEKVLAAVRNLITATLPEQVLVVLTEEAEQLAVRAAVFDVRGKAAWGASARGFGPQVGERVIRALIVPLNQENPFRTCYETGGHVEASVGQLKKNRNILDKFRPDSADAILLLPIRSAGSVSAILYADGGGKGKELPVDALKILTEFAGAQLDRLMAFSGGLGAPAEAVAAEPEPVAEAPVEEAPAEEAPAEAAAVEEVPAEAQVETVEAQAVEVAAISAESPAAVAEEPAAPVLGETVPVTEAAPPAAAPAAEPAAAPAAAPAAFDVAQLSEADQKVHRDAKRFARLLVSEIELYNKAKVADGRKNKDVYKRMKSDIDRSRQTYEKRFGKTVATQVDYFHEELVRTLAANDSSVLGPEYPGPSV